MAKKINSKPEANNKPINISKTTNNINININNNISIGNKHGDSEVILKTSKKEKNTKSLDIINSKSVPDNIFIRELKESYNKAEDIPDNSAFFNTTGKFYTNKSINE